MPLCTTIISGRVYFGRLSAKIVISQVISTSPFLFSLWANFLHPLTICHTVAGESPQNLHIGVLGVLSYLCCAWQNLFLKLVLKRRGSVLFPFLYNHSWTISRTPFQPPEVCRANSPCRVFSFRFLTFPSFFDKHLLLQRHLQHPLCALFRVAIQEFALTLYNSSIPMNPLPLPSLIGRYSLATFFIVCKQPFSGNITTINSKGEKE